MHYSGQKNDPGARPTVKPTGDPQAPLRTIQEVVFGILSPNEIRNMSVTPEGIQYSQVYNDDGTAVLGGLLDPRQGVIDKSSRCLTCSGLLGDCPGHFGHLSLAEPVFHAHFIPKIVKILRCVCFYCYKLIIPATSRKIVDILDKKQHLAGDRTRFALIYEVCKGKTVCDQPLELDPTVAMPNTKNSKSSTVCGRRQPKIKHVGLEIFLEWEKLDIGHGERKQILSAKLALEILSNISDQECKIMGLDPQVSRPEWMIATIFSVPPITIRPIAITFGAAKNQDDLTYKLADIVNANDDVIKAKQEGATHSEIYELVKLLQYHCATLVDNEIPGVPKAVHKSSGKVIRSLKARLKGKEGRIRGNLMGKRVDFSARTVISPDPNLKIDEVGIPLNIAKNLTVPEMVTPYNLERMRALVATGVKKYPGAKYIVRPNGDRIDLRYATSKTSLNLDKGYKVERDLVNGDIVIFNRQPSLHKMSMMGHRVKVLPYTTCRMNLSCTTPYNADFDGDEMNLHVPQSLDVVAEVEQLQLTTRQIITPQSNKPVMGIVQDALTGSMMITRRDSFLDREMIMNLLMHVTTWDGRMTQPAILKPKPLWTGKQLFTLLIPGELNLVRRHSSHLDVEDDGPYKWISVADTKVIITKGHLVSGILCKNTLGTSSGSLLHVCMMELGHEVTGVFYNDVQNSVNYWMKTQGHSIGYRDAILRSDTTVKVRDIVQKAKDDVKTVIEDSGRSAGIGRKKDKNTIEQNINSVLNQAMNEVGSFVQKSMDDSNSLKLMACAGSKGSLINIAQITACIGQLNVEGKRIPFGYGDRTLPHFNFKDDSPESRGFVENSFSRGISPSEYFFQAMAGREGLIDTAVKTAETGYIQRRLMKAMESIMVCYDGTVRNATGHLIQFCYGEDGLAGEKVEFQNLPSLRPSHEKFEQKFKLDLGNLSEQGKLGRIFKPQVISDMSSSEGLGETVKICLDAEWKQLVQDREALRKEVLPTGDDKVVLPCNLERMIWNIRKLFKIQVNDLTDLNPVTVIEEVKKLLKSCTIFYGDGEIKELANANATFMFSCLVRSMLCSRRVCVEYRLTPEAFRQLLCNIEITFQEAKVEPCEMVGAIAAQSIGEPATQMTLNTFHFAGISSKNVTLGVPRLKEIINISKNPKSPSMKIFLRPDFAQDEGEAVRVLCRLENTKLCDIMDTSDIILDVDSHNSIVKEDQEFLNAFITMADCDETDNGGKGSNLSPWVLRIVLDSEKVYRTQMTMDHIAAQISSNFKHEVDCLHSDDNADTLILRIYPKISRKQSKFKEAKKSKSVKKVENAYTNLKNPPMFLRNIESSLLSNISLKGLTNLSRVNLRKTNVADGRKLKREINPLGEFVNVPEWILETEGSSLLHVLGDLSVDAKRTYSSDIWDIFKTLGVEAARKVIEIELRSVLETYGLYVNYRHISLLCDVMTCKGVLMPITRHGVGKQETGPLMRCSFEETADVFIDAAVHSERDYIKGVSEHIIVGQIPRMGTGAFDLILDEEKCKLAKQQNFEPIVGNGPNKFIDRRNRQRVVARIDLDDPDEEGEKVLTGPKSPVIYTPDDVCYHPSSPSYSPLSPTYTPTYASSSSNANNYSPPYSPIPIGSQNPVSNSSPPYGPVPGSSYATSSYAPDSGAGSSYNFGVPVPVLSNLSKLKAVFDSGDQRQSQNHTQYFDQGETSEDLDESQTENESEALETDSLRYPNVNVETLDPSYSPFAPTFSNSSTEAGYKPNF